MARKNKDGPLAQTSLPADYPVFLQAIKSRVRQFPDESDALGESRIDPALLGYRRLIVERQEKEGWGKSVVDRLAGDLQKAFPGLQGFSPRNVWRMRLFFLAYTKDPTNLPQPVAEIGGGNLPQAVAEIPWGHNVAEIEAELEKEEGG
jgi:DUF1016 N-terminal domain